MKKLIVLTVAVIFAIGANAQTTKSTTTSTTSNSGPVSVANPNPCVATMLNGKMYVWGKGVNVLMVQPMSFPNKVTVFPDGHYNSATGKPGQLRNGQCFDAKGNIMTPPPPPPPASAPAK